MEGAVPQSICYIKSKNLFIIAEYHIGKAPSVLQIVDENGTYIKSIILKDMQGKNLNAHVGGIATDENTLWVSDEYKLYWYSLKDILSLSSMESVSATECQELNLKADFITYNNQMLWIGEYEYKPFYNSSKFSKSINTNALLIGYNVNDFSPEFAFSLPKKVQGIVWNNDNLIVSDSFWFLEDSHIKEYEQVLESKIEKNIFIDGKEIPLRKLEDSRVIYEKIAPPMLEGIELVNNKIYMVFESGANNYKYYTHYKVNGLYTLSLNPENI